MLIGNKIRKIRKKKKVSQSNLAKMCKTTRSYMCVLEKGELDSRINLLFSIAHNLGCSVYSLVGFGDKALEKQRTDAERVFDLYSQLDESDQCRTLSYMKTLASRKEKS
jgi:transcriptional regulator with XRE-family HTH domain